MENKEIVKASLSGIRRQSTENAKEIKIGDFVIDNSNPFKKYQQFGSLDIVSNPLDKAALEMTSEFKIYSEDKNQEKDMVQLNEWATNIELDMHIFTVIRELLEKGTVVVYVPQQSDIKELEILPMEYVTLLPKGIKPGATPDHLIKGKVEKIIVNEDSTSSEVKKDTLKRKEVMLYRFKHKTHHFNDIKNRATFGIYGQSIIQKVEWRLEYYFNLLESYKKFIKRYGYGRLFFNSQFMAKLLESESYETFKKMRDDMIKEQETMEENQDILGIGMEAKQLETGTNLDILGLKESLEQDIASMLFGSEISTGKQKATTYASAYVVDQNRIRILESYKKQIKHPIEQLVRKQAENMGIKNTENIKVQFSKLDTARYSAREIAELCTKTVIDEDEGRELLGLKPRIKAGSIELQQTSLVKGALKENQNYPLFSIIIPAPHGELIMRGIQKAIVKPVRLTSHINEPLYLLDSNDCCYGVITLSQGKEIDLDEFATLAPKHLVSEEERTNLWKGKRKLFYHPVRLLTLFPQPRKCNVPADAKNFVKRVEFE